MMLGTLRRGRKDKTKGISLYTDTILDDVERENAAAAKTSPPSPSTPQLSSLSSSGERSIPPRPVAKKPPLKSRLGQSAEVPTRKPPTEPSLDGSDVVPPAAPPRSPLRPQASAELISPIAPQSQGPTGFEQPQSSTGDSEDIPDDKEKDAYFINKDEGAAKLRDNLKKVLSTGKKYNTEATKYVKGMNSVTDVIDKVTAVDKKLCPDSVYVEALMKFVQIDRAIAESTAKYHQKMNDQLLFNVNNFVEEDIQHELKNLKAKYDKARRDYDSACAKVTNLRSKKNIDILKLYAAEKEAIKAKGRYRAALDAAITKVEDIEIKKQTDMMEWIIKYVDEQKESYAECYAMLKHIEGYLQELSSWANEWRVSFGENSFERNKEQQHKFADEDQALHKPLVELVKNEELVAIMKRVASEEGVALPPLDINIQNHWGAVHQFLRANYDPISQALLLGNKKQLLIELSSALGLLEKANEVIELTN